MDFIITEESTIDDSSLFRIVRKIEDDYEKLKERVIFISHHVFYNVLEMTQGCLCGDFRFELRTKPVPKDISSDTIDYSAPVAVVVQQYQNGCHVEPYPNAEFSYPLKWIMDCDCSVFNMTKDEVEVKDEL